MKLYMVYRTIDYEGGYVHGVFSSQERAEEALERVKLVYSADNYAIDELELDVDVPNGGISI